MYSFYFVCVPKTTKTLLANKLDHKNLIYARYNVVVGQVVKIKLHVQQFNCQHHKSKAIATLHNLQKSRPFRGWGHYNDIEQCTGCYLPYQST